MRAASLSTCFFRSPDSKLSSQALNSSYNAVRDQKGRDARKVRSFRRYDVLASHSYEEDLMPDLKEGFIIGEDLPHDEPHVAAGRFFMGSNVWLDPALLPVKDFR